MVGSSKRTPISSKESWQASKLWSWSQIGGVNLVTAHSYHPCPLIPLIPRIPLTRLRFLQILTTTGPRPFPRTCTRSRLRMVPALQFTTMDPEQMALLQSCAMVVQFPQSQWQLQQVLVVPGLQSVYENLTRTGEKHRTIYFLQI